MYALLMKRKRKRERKEDMLGVIHFTIIEKGNEYIIEIRKCSVNMIFVEGKSRADQWSMRRNEAGI